MKTITVRDPRTDEVLRFPIAGETPTAAEQDAMRQAIESRAQRATAAESSAAAEQSAAQPQVPPGIIDRVGQFARQFIPTEQQMRPVFPSAGAAIGGMVGLASSPFTGPAGPILGAATGASLGAAGGSLLADIKGVDESQSLGEGIGRAINEAALETVFRGLGQQIPAILRSAKTRIANVEKGVVGLGERFGVQLGIEDVTPRKFLQGFRSVAGRFPLIAQPLNEASKRRSQQLATALIREFDEVAPVAGKVSSLGDLAIDRAGARFKAARNLIAEESKKIDAVAKATGARVPMDFTRNAAAEIIEESTKRLPTQTVVNEAGETLRRPIRVAGGATDRLLRQLSSVDDMSVEQYRTISKQLNNKITELTTKGLREDAGRLLAVKDAVEKDFLNIQGPPDLVNRVVRFNKTFHAIMDSFERPAAQRFAAVDKRIFDFGYKLHGRQSADQFADSMFSDKLFRTSPRAVRDLRGLVGDEVFRQSYRRHLDDVFDAALDVDPGAGRASLNLQRLEKSLGLFRPKSVEREATAEALRGTGQTVENLEKFMDLARTVSRSNAVDVSQFVARRGILGGFKSVARSFVPGAPAGGDGGLVEMVQSAPQVATLILSLRGFGRFLTDPNALRQVSHAMAPNVTPATRMAALNKAARIAGFRSLVHALGPDSTADQADPFRLFRGPQGAVAQGALALTPPGAATLGAARIGAPLVGAEIGRGVAGRVVPDIVTPVQLSEEERRRLRNTRESRGIRR